MLTAYRTVLSVKMPAMLHLNPTANFSIHPSGIQLPAHEKLMPTYPSLTCKDQ